MIYRGQRLPFSLGRGANPQWVEEMLSLQPWWLTVRVLKICQNSTEVATRALLPVNLRVLQEENAIRWIKTARSVITNTLFSFGVSYVRGRLKFRSTWRTSESGSLESSLHCWQPAGSDYYSIWRTGLWCFERVSSKILRKICTWRSLLEIQLWTPKLLKEVHLAMQKAFLCLRCFETWKMLRFSQSILVSLVDFSQYLKCYFMLKNE